MFSKLFKSLFSGSDKPTAQAADPIEYKGYQIYAEPIDEGQYRLAGRICKTIDGELKTHRFIRSDLFPSQADAEQWMVRKAQIFIDQSGDSMFQ